jgi:predicted O-methyltransferase YrrM
VRRLEPLRNLGLLLSLLPRHPLELRDRMAGYAELGLERLSDASPSYETVGWKRALCDVEDRLGSARGILEEPALVGIEGDTRRLLGDIRREDTFSQRWAADSLLARCCYLLCRLIQPSVVVETGVAYGVSSAFILRAFEVNGRGTLHSIDLPPLRREAGRFWGIAVPERLRGRWRLHRGASGRMLPRLLGEAGPVDLFVHDSLHTLANMRREFETVWPYLRTGGALLADDVERNRAFGELRYKDPTLWRVVSDVEVDPLHGRAAPVVFGVAIK